jgi:mRNA turnover protein 4
LLNTNRYFKNLKMPEFAKAGAVLKENIVLNPGPLTFPATMLDHLRKLGLIVELDDGVIYLREPYTAASAGVPLTPEQAKMLVHMDRRTINFTMKLEGHWSDGKFEEF